MVTQSIGLEALYTVPCCLPGSCGCLSAAIKHRTLGAKEKDTTEKPSTGKMSCVWNSTVKKKKKNV